MITIKPAISTFSAQVQLTPFGAGEPESATVEYRYMPVSKAQELCKDKSVPEAVAALVAGWGAEIDAPYSPENLTQLLDHNPGMAMELLSGYWRGLLDSRAKN